LVWGWVDSTVFLWFPLIFFGLGLVGFYGFPLVSFVLLWFCLGETKEKKIQGKDTPTKESLRRL